MQAPADDVHVAINAFPAQDCYDMITSYRDAASLVEITFAQIAASFCCCLDQRHIHVVLHPRSSDHGRSWYHVSSAATIPEDICKTSCDQRTRSSSPRSYRPGIMTSRSTKTTLASEPHAARDDSHDNVLVLDDLVAQIRTAHDEGTSLADLRQAFSEIAETEMKKPEDVTSTETPRPNPAGLTTFFQTTSCNYPAGKDQEVALRLREAACRPVSCCALRLGASCTCLRASRARDVIARSC